MGICGDIEEMFHQIYIQTEDRDVQHFLWQASNQNKKPDVYVMDVMMNWEDTCRGPAVCQYAHKLAFLVAESIHRGRVVVWPSWSSRSV